MPLTHVYTGGTTDQMMLYTSEDALDANRTVRSRALERRGAGAGQDAGTVIAIQIPWEGISDDYRSFDRVATSLIEAVYEDNTAAEQRGFRRGTYPNSLPEFNALCRSSGGVRRGRRNRLSQQQMPLADGNNRLVTRLSFQDANNDDRRKDSQNTFINVIRPRFSIPPVGWFEELIARYRYHRRAERDDPVELIRLIGGYLELWPQDSDAHKAIRDGLFSAAEEGVIDSLAVSGPSIVYRNRHFGNCRNFLDVTLNRARGTVPPTTYVGFF